LDVSIQREFLDCNCWQSFFHGSLRSHDLANRINRKLVTNSSPKLGYFWAISDQVKPEKQGRQRDLSFTLKSVHHVLPRL
jgi:hypothetical protein